METGPLQRQSSIVSVSVLADKILSNFPLTYDYAIFLRSGIIIKYPMLSPARIGPPLAKEQASQKLGLQQWCWRQGVEGIHGLKWPASREVWSRPRRKKLPFTLAYALGLLGTLWATFLVLHLDSRQEIACIPCFVGSWDVANCEVYSEELYLHSNLCCHQSAFIWH